MLQELTANSGAELFAIGSTLFFIIVFTAIAVRVLTRKAGSYDATARLPLEDAPPADARGRLAVENETRTGGR